MKINSNSTIFNTTWAWSKNRSRVHAFPNIKLESEKLPLRLSELAQLNIAASWTVTPESEYESLFTTDIAANVVVDMFLDPDPQTAKSTTLPKYEIMIWFSAFGGRVPSENLQPNNTMLKSNFRTVGYNDSIKAPPSHSLGGSELYSIPI
jgi:xyloglucan-specific endo-beta-1,4-glucanase